MSSRLGSSVSVKGNPATSSSPFRGCLLADISSSSKKPQILRRAAQAVQTLVLAMVKSFDSLGTAVKFDGMVPSRLRFLRTDALRALLGANQPEAFLPSASRNNNRDRRSLCLGLVRSREKP